ncbi:type II toxin-antitoxin system Phd/YefM family antitoxin [Nonomuraea glycinis]|jgi:prevent-host-death family protein|uniref:type II toxin-antitoxin system Phd/YefM family antitoxin n=1 Tax=Nonomuraea glycinis TaxID=2047744 RepID=UPI002E160265|nr:type II toxin-antitoxin system prevent-host-death family antitoxin [Nonomuraea glycinis]
MDKMWQAFPEINQEDLENRTSQILDAVERGESFTLTRHGRPIATITPLAAAERSGR